MRLLEKGFNMNTKSNILPGHPAWRAPCELRLTLSRRGFSKLEKMMNDSGACSHAETIRNALRFYEWYLRQKQNGVEIHVVDGNEQRHVEFEF